MSKVFRLTITFTKLIGAVLILLSSALSFYLNESEYFVIGVSAGSGLILGQNIGNQFGKKCNENI